mmetsp:Transcript_87752/g.283370  ORF Transcript_87752/g.283370 Transcript_87752/m.283370 type:complete len:209 (+) Transcript_87752:1905-2531(+)
MSTAWVGRKFGRRRARRVVPMMLRRLSTVEVATQALHMHIQGLVRACSEVALRAPRGVRGTRGIRVCRLFALTDEVASIVLAASNVSGFPALDSCTAAVKGILEWSLPRRRLRRLPGGVAAHYVGGTHGDGRRGRPRRRASVVSRFVVGLVQFGLLLRFSVCALLNCTQGRLLPYATSATTRSTRRGRGRFQTIGPRRASGRRPGLRR